MKIKLSGPQHSIMRSKKRFRVVVAGRRFGKTFLAIGYLLERAAIPGTTNWLVAPTYRQAKQIAWKMLRRLCPPTWKYTANESDLTLTFPWGSEISLRGADNPDSLRGVALHSVVLDEYADMDSSAWPEVLRPALADTKGSALFIGTPKGYNHFYDLWSAAHEREDWGAWSYTTEEGGNVDPEEIAAARAELDERTFRQEFMASFETLSGRVYRAFERAQNVADVTDNGTDLLIGMDFNVDPMSAVVGVRCADQLHILDEIEIPNGNTEIMSAEINRRYGGRRIQVFPDPSGQGRRTAAPVGVTDHAILRSAGFQVIAPKQAPLVVDRINETNGLMRNANGVVRCFIHPRCKRLIRCLEGLTYKEGTSVPDKSLGLDHLPDALGYLIHSEFPIVSKRRSFQPFSV